MNDSKQKFKYLLVNIAAFLCGSLGSKLISFFMVPLYTNVLQPEQYGELDLILSVAGVLSPFVACGIHEGIMRFSLDKGANRPLVFSIGLRTFLISSAIFLAIIPVVKQIPLIADDAVFLYLYCILNELMTIFLCYIRGKDNTKLYAFLGFLSALFTASLNILFLVAFHWGEAGYKASMLLSPVLTSLVAVFLGRLLPDLSVRKWEKKTAGEMLKYSFILIPNALLWWCINASDRFFVSYMCGTAENGLYAVAYKIPTLLSTVASIFMQAWQMSAIKEHEEENGNKFSETIYRNLTVFICAATLVLMLINKTVLSVYVGEEYFGAWAYSPVLMLSFFAGALASFWGSFYIAAKKMKTYLLSAIVGALINIVLNFVMIRSLGTIGAAIATAVSYIAVFLVRGFGICTDVRIRVWNFQLVTASVCLLIGLIASYLPGYLAWGIGLVNLAGYLLLNRKLLVDIFKLPLKLLRRNR